MTTLPLNHGLEVMIDDEDLELVSKYNWLPHPQGKRWRAVTRPQSNKVRRTVFMHRLIMDAKPGQIVDHIDLNPLNNQKSNLRFATTSQNAGNAGLSKRNKLGYKGVSMCNRKNQPYIAQICINRKHVFIGRFADPIEAARAYDKASREHFGEFAYTNFKVGAV